MCFFLHKSSTQTFLYAIKGCITMFQIVRQSFFSLLTWRCFDLVKFTWMVLISTNIQDNTLGQYTRFFTYIHTIYADLNCPLFNDQIIKFASLLSDRDSVCPDFPCKWTAGTAASLGSWWALIVRRRLFVGERRCCFQPDANQYSM